MITLPNKKRYFCKSRTCINEINPKFQRGMYDGYCNEGCYLENQKSNKKLTEFF